MNLIYAFTDKFCFLDYAIIKIRLFSLFFILVPLVDLGNLYQLGLNGLLLTTSKWRTETGIEVAMRQLSFMSYTNHIGQKFAI